MPYRRSNELPKELNKLPSEAKVIYSRAFNNAEKYYAKKHGISTDKVKTDVLLSKVAWSAVKQKFRKVKDNWVKKIN